MGEAKREGELGVTQALKYALFIAQQKREDDLSSRFQHIELLISSYISRVPRWKGPSPCLMSMASVATQRMTSGSQPLRMAV